MSQFSVTTVHGEGRSVFHVVDGTAPDEEQPAIVDSFDTLIEAQDQADILNGDIVPEDEGDEVDVSDEDVDWWRKEVAREEGMLGGIDSYNDWGGNG